METSKIINNLYSNFHHILIFILLIIILSKYPDHLEKLISKINSKDCRSGDTSYEIMSNFSEEEKNLLKYTQLNTRLNKENLNNAESLSNKCIYCIFTRSSRDFRL